jgi:hypothetical protein
VETWAPRIGNKAARLQVRASILNALGALLGSAWIFLLALGFATHDGALRVCGLALLVTDLCLFALGATLGQKARRAMSQFLGVRVELLNTPTLHEDGFRHWCQRHGVERI